MVIDKILGNITQKEVTKKIVSIKFDWFELEKKRISKTAVDGVQFAICINNMLTDGDILCETDDTIYICDVNSTEVIKTYVKTMEEMGRLCFELGNRHLSLKIEKDNVIVPFDNPTFEYLLKLGFNSSREFEKFVSFTDCKAHGTSSSHSHHKHVH